MRRPAVVLGLTALACLAGCHGPGGTVTRTLTVEFQSADSAAARPVVIARCGHLPGVTNSPVATGDPNVILDYSHATNPQFAALTSCLGTLQQSQPELAIRAVVNHDGTDS